MDKPFRGIFPVLQTPVTPDGALDVESLRREVAFCIEAGVHGIVFPALGSELFSLTDEERRRLVEVVVHEAGGAVPTVVGVTGENEQVAVEHARHAARVRASAVIALPPQTRSENPEAEIREYYVAIAKAADLPVFIQHTHPTMDVPLIRELLEGVENIRYVKEEMAPSAHQISALLRAVGDACSGVFGGSHGRWMMSELHRGAAGFMPAVEAVDVHVRVWEAYESGDEAGARAIYNRLLPLMNLILILGLPVCKEVLVRRGVFRCAGMRSAGAVALDSEDRRELDFILADLEPLFR